MASVKRPSLFQTFLVCGGVLEWLFRPEMFKGALVTKMGLAKNFNISKQGAGLDLNQESLAGVNMRITSHRWHLQHARVL
jgi:hypothetical protein